MSVKTLASWSAHARSTHPDLKTEPHPESCSRTGCMEQHYAVQEGRADHQDWRKCQRQVQTFKNIMMTFQKAWKKQLMRQLDVTERYRRTFSKTFPYNTGSASLAWVTGNRWITL
uniref:Uncharacterized protein n=1 Tax=Hucho hucho TaxID=62062 RepID=A0A4W5RUV3_9TELE